MSNLRVGIVGATGETGGSIVNGLLEAGNFSIVALTRPASVEKPAVQALKEQGIEVVAADLSGDQDALVNTLKNIDVLISAVSAHEQPAQIPLADAAKKAGVKRFIPCAFITVAAPGGIMALRDWKEEIYNHIKKIRLPYTIIDVGWWYQISLPPTDVLPEKLKHYTGASIPILIGDGNVPTGLTDLRDIGKYVARIIADDRTLNKYVFAYNELWTPNKIYSKLEEVLGETLRRDYVPADEIAQRISAAEKNIKSNPADTTAMLTHVSSQYQYSWGVRGDNTPENARYLGYLVSKDLYPDMKFTSFDNFLQDLLEGKAKQVYQNNATIQNLVKEREKNKQ